MKFLRAIRRFLSKSWLVAAPLVILGALIAIPLCLAIVERFMGPEAAESFSAAWFGALMWAGELTLLFAPIALVIFVTIRVARRLVGKKTS